jgi:PAS domain S-box-containing protein
MSRLRNLPIQKKLTLVIMLTCSIVLVLTSVVLFVYHSIKVKEASIHDITTLGRVIAHNSSAAVAFNDRDAAAQTLSGLEDSEVIEQASLMLANGETVSRFDRENEGDPAVDSTLKDGYRQVGADVLFATPVELDGKRLGTLYLRADFAQTHGRLLSVYGGTLAIVLAVSLLLALFLANWFQRFITAPILRLAGVVQHVAQHGDYSLRAASAGSDEVGVLSDAFNGLLHQIRTRDRALQEAHDGLERRVAERTAELQNEMAERHRTEQERDRFFTLSLDLLCIAGHDGYFKRVNPAFQRILGFDEEHFLARPFLESVHPDDVFTTLEQMQELAEGRLVANYEHRCRCQDGSWRWIAWSATPVPGEPVFYAYGRDITERRQSEEAMERMNRRLLDVSRQAGMAEVATSVLHNVGNVLNSVNVSCSVVSDKLRKSPITGVAKTAEMLQQHQGDLAAFFTNDPTGQKLPGFLTKLAAYLSAEQTGILAELQSLSQNIHHINDIVAMQQSYAKNVGGVQETLPLDELVEDALRLNDDSLVRHQIEIVRDFGMVEPIPLEKHKVLQILVNLVRNAKHALADSGRSDKRLVIRIQREDSRILVSVTDNGIGIPPENLTRIFAHGFTTKPNGHGFGLHSGVLAAQEMGGRLMAHSEGLGTGATFTLELPLNTITSP